MPNWSDGEGGCDCPSGNAAGLGFHREGVYGCIHGPKEKPKIPFSPRMLARMRVRWFIDRGRTGYGTVTAVYTDGTCDVQSDLGPFFKGWDVRGLEPDDR